MRKKSIYNIRHTYNSCLCNSPSKLEYNPVKWQMPAVQMTHFSFSVLLTTFWKNQTRAKEESDFHSTQARREMLRLGPNCIHLTAPLFSPSRLKWAVAMEMHRGPSPHWMRGESHCWRAKWKSRRCQSQYFFLLFPPPFSTFTLCRSARISASAAIAAVSHAAVNLPRPLKHCIHVKALLNALRVWVTTPCLNSGQEFKQKERKEKKNTWGGSEDQSQAGPTFTELSVRVC